ncbi:hypothetical protein LJR098_000227 [Rhizobium sp. LjRoot98]|uniref:hypothetical protein n=1 Tax=unclassified Rhizobium TaxID=2613769 RepID=UPI0012E37794|nr:MULTISPECIES: hypothetical protein [unclassified Rhizobium]
MKVDGITSALRPIPDIETEVDGSVWSRQQQWDCMICLCRCEPMAGYLGVFEASIQLDWEQKIGTAVAQATIHLEIAVCIPPE